MNNPAGSTGEGSNYYQPGQARAGAVRQLFTRIAPHYDLINDLQSLGIHRLWKRRMVSLLRPEAPARVLDLACGSGDIVSQWRRTCPGAQIIGGDLTLPMLQVARSRSAGESSPSSPRAHWINLDALALPFPPGVFDAVSIAYGLRNMLDPLLVLKEALRVLRRGGRIAILDFGRPSNLFIRASYYAMLRTVQPMLGSLFFRDAAAYGYIYDSLVRYPAQEGVTRLLAKAGFDRIICHDLTLGAMSVHVATKC